MSPSNGGNPSPSSLPGALAPKIRRRVPAPRLVILGRRAEDLLTSAPKQSDQRSNRRSSRSSGQARGGRRRGPCRCRFSCRDHAQGAREAGSAPALRHPRPSCRGSTGVRSKTVGPVGKPKDQQILGTSPRSMRGGLRPRAPSSRPLSRDPATARPRGGRVFSAQGLGLAGCRTRSGMTASARMPRRGI